MKKILLFASALAGLFLAASCQQESLEPVGGNTVTYTVQVPDALATKAAVGDEYVADHLIYEVYRDAELSDLAKTPIYEGTATINAQGQASLELEFVKNQNFTVLFWAQKSGVAAYTTDDLRKVTLNQPLTSNDVNMAVYAGTDKVANCVSATNGAVTLSRPIAQLNLATAPESLTIGTNATPTITLVSSYAKVTGLSTTYNVATKAVGADESEFIYADASVLNAKLEVNSKQYHYASMNYVGFIAEEGATIDVEYTLTTSEGDINHTIGNVPVKPNYRTNIVGNLISSASEYTITLDAVWAGVAEEVEIWDGKFLSQPAYDNVTKTWSVKKASELAWLAAAVNGTVPTRSTEYVAAKTFAGETFVLTEDIDLGNHPWTPIGLTGDQAGFQGVFDGNGKTISNLYVNLTGTPKHQSAGLFGSLTGTVKNLYVKNAVIKNLDTDTDATSSGSAVIAGASQNGAFIDNVHVVNAVVTSNRRAAGIAGYFVGTIQNCSVDGLTATITPDDYDGDGKYKNGDKAGGILATTNGATVLKNNVVKNANIKGYRNLGGLAGAANLGENSSNKVENTVVTVDRTYTMVENDAALSGPIVGRIFGGTLDESNVATDVVVVSTEEDVETPESFSDALANVADGGVVAVAAEDIVITAGELAVAGNNITIVGTTDDATITVNKAYPNPVKVNKNVTFKNLNINFADVKGSESYNGFNSQGNTLVFDNCTFTGQTTAAGGKFIYNNCSFKAENTYPAFVYSETAEYNNCVFEGKDRAAKVYNEQFSCKATYNNCTFKAATADKAAVEIDCSLPSNANKSVFEIIINNATLVNMGQAADYGNEYFNLETAGVGLGIVTLDGKGYSVAHTAAQLQALTNAGKDVTIEFAQDIEGDLTIVQKADADVVLFGNDKNYEGVITVNGDGRSKGAETLTFTDINFTTDARGKSTFINAPSKIGDKYNYSHNVTIENCDFTSQYLVTDESSADYTEIGSASFTGTYNFVMRNCTATRMHSLLQVQSCDNTALVENVVVTDCKNGVSFGNTAYPTIKNADIMALAYGVRADGDANRGKLVMKNVDITAAYPLTVRKMKDASFNAYEVSLDNETTLTTTAGHEYHIIFTNHKDEYVLESPVRTYSITGADSYKVYPRDNQ